MAVDNPFGLRPVRYQDGRPYNGERTKVYAASGTANIFIGDPVRPDGSADADAKYMGVEVCPGTGATPDRVLGVCVGIVPDENSPGTLHSATGSNRYLYICTAKDLIYEVQEDADSDPINADDVGNSFDHISTVSGDTSTGISGIELDSTTHSASDGQWRLLGRSKRIENGTDHDLEGNAIWEVMMNESELHTGAAGT